MKITPGTVETAEKLALKTMAGALGISDMEVLQNFRMPEEMIDLVAAKLEDFVRNARKVPA